MNVPADLKYTSSHEWVRVEGDLATIGITDYAQSELGDIVYVEAPEVGRAVKEGETVGTVESVKAVSDVYSPLSGRVTASNASLNSEPELINASPYEKGYIYQMSLADASEATKLLDASAYQKLLS